MTNYHNDLIEKFLKKIGSVGQDNANNIRSYPVLQNLLSSSVAKRYLFDVIYKDTMIGPLHKEGFIYHHQTSKITPYCIGLSAYDLAVSGLRSNAQNARVAKPPTRLDSLFNQTANLICMLTQEVSGATSINDLSTIAAGFLYFDELKFGPIDNKIIENIWQSFLFNINLPFRSGESPFSNITIDFSAPAYSLKDRNIVYSGEIKDIFYKDIPIEYYDRINIAFANAMYCGDGNNQPFTFPLITINISDNFDFEEKTWKQFVEKSEYFGGFYLQNYCTRPFNEEERKINPYHESYDMDMVYSNCCRVIFNKGEVIKVTGSNPFASGSGIGGIGVININLNRILWLSQGDIKLIRSIISYLIKASSDALEMKRLWVREYWNDLYPFLSYFVKDDKSLFSIISVIGMHEGLQSMGYEEGIYNKTAQKLAHVIALMIRKEIDKQIKHYGTPFALEFAPSESASYKLAKKDIEFSNKLMRRFNKDPNLVSLSSEDEFVNGFIISSVKQNHKLLFRKI